jgi:hypothetical protein
MIVLRIVKPDKKGRLTLWPSRVDAYSMMLLCNSVLSGVTRVNGKTTYRRLQFLLSGEIWSGLFKRAGLSVLTSEPSETTHQ